MKRVLIVLFTMMLLVMFGCGHNHNFSSEYYYDEEGHYHLCKCGEKKDVEEHQVSDFIILEEATSEKKGYKHKICTICNKEIIKEEILKTISISENEFDERLNKNEIINISITSLKSDKMYNVSGCYKENNLEGEYETILSFDYIRNTLLKCDTENNENKYLKLVSINEKILDELVRDEKNYDVIVDPSFAINKTYIQNMLKFKVINVDSNYKNKANEDVILITVSILENFTKVDTNNVVKDLIKKENSGNNLKLFVSIDKDGYFKIGEEYIYHFDSSFEEKINSSDKEIYAYNLDELEFLLPLKDDRIDDERLIDSQTRNYKSIFCANMVLTNDSEKLKTTSTIEEFREWLTNVKNFSSQTSYNVTEIYDIRTGKTIEKIKNPI